MNRLLLFSLSLTTFTACSQADQKVESPEGYDFSRPVIYEMPEELKEISGISFYPGKKDTMYAIQDEQGSIFYWKNGQDKEVSKSKFGKHGDFEDVAITNIYAFVLRSDGTLFQFPISETRKGNVDSVREWPGLMPPGEYESLYANAENNELYIVCKNCGADKKEEAVSGYILQMNETGGLAFKSSFRIDTRDISGLTTKKNEKIRLSAITFNKKTDEWYLLSSVNKMLIIADKDWKIKKAIGLSTKFFPQPEGITFDIDNNLYISSEAGNTAAGTVLMFPYKGSGK